MLKSSSVTTAVLAVAIFAVSTALADTELRAGIPSAEVTEKHDLGSVEVEGIGAVSLTAKRKGSVVEVTAHGANGVAIGRAETTIGLSQSPIYLNSEGGLVKVVVLWKSGE